MMVPGRRHRCGRIACHSRRYVHPSIAGTLYEINQCFIIIPPQLSTAPEAYLSNTIEVAKPTELIGTGTLATNKVGLMPA